jgi:uncharacterized membrane protein YraQ (UPF0718 family)
MSVELGATFLLRAAQVFAAAMPTILLGMLAAGVLVRVIGEDRLRRVTGGDGWSEYKWAWLLGVVLPVCPLGVMPVLFTLWRMRVSTGSLVIVALSGPLVTPWTIGYLADRAGWGVAGFVLISNAVIAYSVALSIRKRGIEATRVRKPIAPESTQLLGTLIAAGRSIQWPVVLAMLIGLAGVGIVATLIPPNAAGEWLVERSALHATILVLISLLSIVLPSTIALHAGEIANGSTMPGLIVPMVALGAGLDAGLISLGAYALGVRRFLIAATVGILLAVVIGVGFDAVVRDAAYSPEDSHAFEDLGRPFHLLIHPDGPLAGLWHRFTRVAGVESIAAGIGVIVLLVIGRLKREALPASVVCFPSTRWLRAAGGLLMVAIGLLILYTYYPSPSTSLREVSRHTAEMMSASSPDEALRRRAAILRRLGQLEVSSLLHGQPLSADERTLIAKVKTGIASSATSRISGQLTVDQAELLRDMERLKGRFQ